MNELSIFFLIILFLIICSAFFSSSETALTAVSEARINELVNKGNKKAKLIEKILLQNWLHILMQLYLQNYYL